MTLCIEKIRKEIPLLGKRIYLKTAAIGPMSRAALDAGEQFDRDCVEDDADRLPEWLQLCETTRSAAATFLHAHPDEIALTTSTTDGENIVAFGLQRLGKGDHVLTDELDFAGNLRTWRKASERRGFDLTVLENGKGFFTIEDYERAIRPNTRVIAVAMVSNKNGFTHDIKTLANFAHSRGAILLIDAIQACGAYEIDVTKLDADVITFGTYKWLLGTLGLGICYIKRHLISELEPRYWGWLQYNVLVDNRLTGARKFEHATQNFRGLAQLSAAFQYLSDIGMQHIEERVRSLTSYVRNKMEERGKTPLCPREYQGTIVSYDEPKAEELARRCIQNGILIPYNKEGMTKITISPHFFNTTDDIDAAMKILLP